MDLSAPEISAKLMRLKELVQWQPGSVVSRTLIDTNSGSVTAFAFDEGQGLSEHTAPYDALVTVVEGEVEIRISDEVFHLKEDEMIICRPRGPTHSKQ
jgi:quercetin dioxygenase-like cupin family protein